MDDLAKTLIEALELEPHPEGGHYRRIHASAIEVEANGHRRPAMTAVRYLLAAGECSRWHRVDADEAWHFYEGDPLELLVAGSPAEVRRQVLGPVAEGSLPQRTVSAHAWQAARCLGAYTLVGCNVAPGFDRTPEVINGCSDLLVDIFGDAGRHARSAVGLAELPTGIAVEIELIARVR